MVASMNPSWEEVLLDIEAAVATYEGAAELGEAGDVFQLPDAMPPMPEALLPRVTAIQQRIASLVQDHEHQLASLRGSIAATTRATPSHPSGDVLNELA
jgi:hypothetical protein